MGANAQTAVPAFTAGQVLTAAQQTQINTGIPVFATTVTRDAAFGGSGEKTLAQGQHCYLESTSALQVYTGSAWVNVGDGLSLIKTQTIGTAVGSVTVSDVFSTSYDAYKIIVSGGVSSAANTNVMMTLGATATGYSYGLLAWASGGTVTAGGTNQTSQQVGESNTNVIMVSCELVNPFLTTYTTYSAGGVWNTTNNNARQYAGALLNSTSYTAFTLTASTGTFTGGTIRVYGYKN
jgi:hypothetical protein